MTLKEFNRQVNEILHAQFHSTHTHPLDVGIERNRFTEQQLTQLIDLARQAPFTTAKRRLAAWERQLVRARQARCRMESAKAGYYPGTQRTVATRPAQARKLQPSIPGSSRQRA